MNNKIKMYQVFKLGIKTIQIFKLEQALWARDCNKMNSKD